MSTPPPEDKRGLSTGAIIGIVLIALLTIGAGICGTLIRGG